MCLDCFQFSRGRDVEIVTLLSLFAMENSLWLNKTNLPNMKLRTFSFLFQVRVDSGIQPGSDISIYYDPMISKVSSISLFSLKQYTHLIKESEVEPFLNNVL